MFGSFLPGLWLVGTTKVYPELGADTVMESITLPDPRVTCGITEIAEREWCARRDSNSQSTASKAAALSITLRAHSGMIARFGTVRHVPRRSVMVQIERDSYQGRLSGHPQSASQQMALQVAQQSAARTSGAEAQVKTKGLTAALKRCATQKRSLSANCKA
jgi:hypothetical protein